MDGEGEILKLKTEVQNNSKGSNNKHTTNSVNSKNNSLKELLSLPNINISESARKKIAEFKE